MSVDFAALAMAVVSGVSDVRACLVVSRDGLALGAHPASEEEKALAVWSRVAALGEVERGFVALRDEVWAFCRRGPYAALCTGHPSARPGVLLDALEQMLLAAEEGRVRKDALRSVQERDGPGSDALRGPRTPLHPGSREETSQPAPVEGSSSASLAGGSFSAWVERLRAQALQAKAAAPVAEEPAAEPAQAVESADQSAPPPEEPPLESEEHVRERSRSEVDTASLSREFAGLLAEGQDDDQER